MLKTIVNTIKAKFKLKTKPPNPIEWRFKTKKTSFNTYQIHITAMIEHPWRLYTEETTLEGPLATTIEFEESSFINTLGDLKEKGRLNEEYNKDYKVKTYYYSSVVDYIQDIIAFTNLETLRGTIYYTPCTEKHCLTMMTKQFQIALI